MKNKVNRVTDLHVNATHLLCEGAYSKLEIIMLFHERSYRRLYTIYIVFENSNIID